MKYTANIAMDSDKTLIEKAINGYFEAFNTYNVDAMTTLFAEDGSVMAPDFATVTGTEQIRNGFTWAFKDLRFHLEYQIDRVLIEGNVASVQAHSHGTSTIVSTGKTVPAQPYRQLFVLRKTGNEWRITDYIYNSSGNITESK